jgi:hypothetical protein
MNGIHFLLRLRPRAALLAFGATFALGASAQTLDFGSCVRVDDASARLACYDRAAGRKPTSQPAVPAAPAVAPAPRAPVGDVRAPVTPPPVAPAPAMPRDPAASFGAEKPVDSLTASQVKTEKKKQKDDEVRQIEARITEVRTRPEGQQVITLDNGQVWGQSEVQREPQFQVGDVVIIRRAMLGSFLLNLQKGSPSTRVKRIS